MKIVSLLPAATEMVYALGLGDELVGRSHECNYPDAVRALPVVSKPVLPVERMSPREIDREVAALLREGESLYRVDDKLLRELAPDVIVTQALCKVCAPDGNELGRSMAGLTRSPRVLTMSPSSLAEVWENILLLGEAAGIAERARKVAEQIQARVAAVTARSAAVGARPRVFCMEWLDPIYNAGHWMPEMVRIAGGVDELAAAGAYSVRMEWEQVRAYAPEVLVLAPCGFDAAQAAEQVGLVNRLPGWNGVPAVRDGRVYAVNAQSYFARPGPRLVDGIELLAHLIHPAVFGWNGPADAFIQL